MDNFSAISSVSKTRNSTRNSTRTKRTVSVTGTAEKTIMGNVSLKTCFNSENPFRRAAQSDSTSNVVVTHSRSLPRPAHPTDPLSYKDELFIRSVGSYNACVKPEVKIGATPSRSEVTDTLVKLTRKTILSYNARIVETGAALRVTH